VSIY